MWRNVAGNGARGSASPSWLAWGEPDKLVNTTRDLVNRFCRYSGGTRDETDGGPEGDLFWACPFRDAGWVESAAAAAETASDHDQCQGTCAGMCVPQDRGLEMPNRYPNQQVVALNSTSTRNAEERFCSLSYEECPGGITCCAEMVSLEAAASETAYNATDATGDQARARVQNTGTVVRGTPWECACKPDSTGRPKEEASSCKCNRGLNDGDGGMPAPSGSPAMWKWRSWLPISSSICTKAASGQDKMAVCPWDDWQATTSLDDAIQTAPDSTGSLIQKEGIGASREWREMSKAGRQKPHTDYRKWMPTFLFGDHPEEGVGISNWAFSLRYSASRKEHLGFEAYSRLRFDTDFWEQKGWTETQEWSDEKTLSGAESPQGCPADPGRTLKSCDDDEMMSSRTYAMHHAPDKSNYNQNGN